MTKIYKNVKKDIYVLPLPKMPNVDDRKDSLRCLIIDNDSGVFVIKWGWFASYDLLECSLFYECIGEIDLDAAIVRAVMEAVQKCGKFEESE